MSICTSLLAFGVRYVCDVAVEDVLRVVEDRMTDHSQALPKALARANDRAWQAVGLALVGDGFFERLKDVFRDGDLKGVRDQVKKFLDSTPTGLEAASAALRVQATEEWHRLRKAKRLAAESIPPALVARQAATLQRYSAPAQLTLAAHRAVADTANALREEAPHLADLLTTAPANGSPLLAAAFAFFFRREVETNAELAHGLTFDLLRQLSDRHERGFQELEASLGAHLGPVIDRLDSLFDALAAWFARLGQNVDEILARLGQYDDTMGRLRDFLDRNEVPASSSKPASVSIASEEELQRLRAIRDVLRSLPPELLSAADWTKLGDALRAAGLFRDAGGSDEAAAAAARAVADRAAEAQAEFNRFKDACETSDWGQAATALRRAVALDRIAYQPFDWHRYELVGVLGAGGFGVVFHCRDRFDLDPDTNQPAPVAIKTLHHDGLDRTVEAVFREARTLKKLDHPHIIKIRDQDYAHKVDEQTHRRPYFVLEYFPGQTLEAYLQQHKTIPAADLLRLAHGVAAALQAAHAAGVLHRDLKPANLLVVRRPDGGWDLRVIDFGLAVKVTAAARASMNVPSDRRSTQDRSFAGTLDYAAPEQMGKLPGVTVGTYSDVFAFGRLCIECLFGIPSVQSGHWRKLPEKVREGVRALLECCVTFHLDTGDPDVPGRFRSFEPVIAELAALLGEPTVVVTTGTTTVKRDPQPNRQPPPPPVEPPAPLLRRTKPDEPPANPKAGDIFSLRIMAAVCAHQPGEIVTVTIPSVDCGPKPGTPAALTWKPVPARPNPHK